MNDNNTPANQDGNGKSLSSTEYRHRLLNKLGCLISVLEVAIGKIGNSMDEDGANQDRLFRIKSNLENTLAICRRAKATLEKRIAEDGGKQPTAPSTPKPGGSIDKANMTFRSYVELSSIDEFRKFKSLEAISQDEIKEVDMDDLADKFFGND